MCDQQRLRPACACAQSDQSLCLPLEYFMTVKLLSKIQLEFLSLKGGCTGSSESNLSKCHMVGNHMSRLICILSIKSLYHGCPNILEIIHSLKLKYYLHVQTTFAYSFDPDKDQQKVGCIQFGLKIGTTKPQF